MRTMRNLFSCLLLSLCAAVPAFANTGEIGSVIEIFIAKHFPEARSHFWVVNNTEWGSKGEVVVDLNAIVNLQKEKNPTEKRFLLLIVDGKLAGVQRVPLGATVECEPDEVI